MPKPRQQRREMRRSARDRARLATAAALDAVIAAGAPADLAAAGMGEVYMAEARRLRDQTAYWERSRAAAPVGLTSEPA